MLHDVFYTEVPTSRPESATCELCLGRLQKRVVDVEELARDRAFRADAQHEQAFLRTRPLVGVVDELNDDPGRPSGLCELQVLIHVVAEVYRIIVVDLDRKLHMREKRRRGPRIQETAHDVDCRVPRLFGGPVHLQPVLEEVEDGAVEMLFLARHHAVRRFEELAGLNSKNDMDLRRREHKTGQDHLEAILALGPAVASRRRDVEHGVGHEHILERRIVLVQRLEAIRR
mmetsp:Transcript_9250/g.31702  ORF Transcript_9250/g.31702 Transcript_9250/m.31702 type:complete len:229 (-) Transcript_9250:1239-1925(-)